MNKAMSKDSNPSPEKVKHYKIGNLTLFLAGDMGANINEAMVYLDGSSITV
jgi:enoyl-[acyl-carrier-protein] reductase (NADH)